jgi:hypothetical protein
MSFMLLGILNAQAAGGGAGAFDLLETTTLTTSASSITFSGLGAYSDYKHLQIRMVTRADTSGFAAHYMEFNGDSAANYTTHRLLGTGSSVSPNNYVAEDYIRLGDSERLTQSVADSFAPTIVDLLDFASTTKTTTARVLNGRTGGVSGASPRINLNSGLWTSTDAITSVLFKNFANYVAGTRISLYGVK